jgi:Amt family ammonium transporter
MVALGALILWLGWYGFNPGSTLCIVGECAEVAAKVAVNTTIGGASGLVATLVYVIVSKKKFDMGLVANGMLTGLVSITAPCAVVEPWGAWLIGVTGVFIFITISLALKNLRIDDPLDASPLHAGCGIWGVLAVGIFGNDGDAGLAGYYGSASGHHPFRSGEQFAVQLVGIFCIVLWTLGMAFLLFYGIKVTIGLRVSMEIEGIGLDLSEHGAQCYYISGIDERIEKVNRTPRAYVLIRSSFRKRSSLLNNVEL